MNEVINISINQTELLFIILVGVFLISGVYWWINHHIKSVTQEYEVRLLSMVCDDIENNLKKVIVAPSTSTVGMTAKQARQAKERSVNDIDLDELLKPVFDKIAKASSDGYGEVFLSGQAWYYNKNEKYMKATEKLTELGYQVWKDRDGFGVKVKW